MDLLSHALAALLGYFAGSTANGCVYDFLGLQPRQILIIGGLFFVLGKMSTLRFIRQHYLLYAMVGCIAAIAVYVIGFMFR
jgi:hypothetical protein